MSFISKGKRVKISVCNVLVLKEYDENSLTTTFCSRSDFALVAFNVQCDRINALDKCIIDPLSISLDSAKSILNSPFGTITPISGRDFYSKSTTEVGKTRQVQVSKRRSKKSASRYLEPWLTFGYQELQR